MKLFEGHAGCQCFCDSCIHNLNFRVLSTSSPFSPLKVLITEGTFGSVINFFLCKRILL